jgi:hypothetical protein
MRAPARRRNPLVARLGALLVGGAIGCTPLPAPGPTKAPAPVVRTEEPTAPAPFRLPSSALAARLPADVLAFAVVDTASFAQAAPRALPELEGPLASRREPIATTFARTFAKPLDLKLDDAARIVGDLEHLAWATRASTTAGSEPLHVIVGRVMDPSVVEPLLASKRLAAIDATRGAYRFADDTKPPSSMADWHLAWLPDERLLAFGSSGLVHDVARVVRGDFPSLATTPRWAASGLDDARRPLVASLDPAALVRALSPGNARLASAVFEGAPPAVAHVDDGGRLRLALGFEGPAVPHARFIPKPSSLGLARRLPAEAYAFATFAGVPAASPLERARELEARIAAFDPALGPALNRLATALGEPTSGLVELLGSDGAIAALGPLSLATVGPSTFVGRASSAPASKARATLFVHAVRDAARVRATLDRLARAPTRGDGPRPWLVRDRDAYRRSDPAEPLAIQLIDDYLLVGLGDRALVDRSTAAFRTGRRVLGDDPTLVDTVARSEGAHGIARVDLRRAIVVAIDDEDTRDDLLEALGALTSSTTVTARLRTDDARWLVELDADPEGVALAASFAVRAFRAFTSGLDPRGLRAKRDLGVLARAARDAYEKARTKGSQHRFCASAIPVPEAIPKAAYTSSTREGRDYLSGDASKGWRCLRDTPTQPQLFRFHYNTGSGYLGPARGGPDPGPLGFEVAAEADLDGDGITRLYTRTGRVDPATNTVVLAPREFVADEYE